MLQIKAIAPNVLEPRSMHAHVKCFGSGTNKLATAKPIYTNEKHALCEIFPHFGINRND
jgi:hypothetical protein